VLKRKVDKLNKDCVVLTNIMISFVD
jgi:hypothetical protein